VVSAPSSPAQWGTGGGFGGIITGGDIYIHMYAYIYLYIHIYIYISGQPDARYVGVEVAVVQRFCGRTNIHVPKR